MYVWWLHHGYGSRCTWIQISMTRGPWQFTPFLPFNLVVVVNVRGEPTATYRWAGLGVSLFCHNKAICLAYAKNNISYLHNTRVEWGFKCVWWRRCRKVTVVRNVWTLYGHSSPSNTYVWLVCDKVCNYEYIRGMLVCDNFLSPSFVNMDDEIIMLFTKP